MSPVWLDALDERLPAALRRRPEAVLVAAALIFLAATAVHADRYGAGAPPTLIERDAEESGAVEESPAATELAPDDPSATVGEADIIGPRGGTELPDYERERAAELERLADADDSATTTAIVSLHDYELPGTLAELLADLDVEVRAVRWQLRAPDARTPPPLPRSRVVVDDDMSAVLVPLLRLDGVSAQRQADDLAAMAEDTEDEAFAEQFTRDAARLRQAAEAVGEDGCACIYAVEVDGPLSELVELAGREGVRLVDVAPPGIRADRVTFLAVLPEDTVRAGARE